MRKIIALMLTFCLLISFTIPVFALEGTESPEMVETYTDDVESIDITFEPSETVSEVTEPPETAPDPTYDSDPIETLPEFTEPLETVPDPSEPLKVDLTEDSINAIADAVMLASSSTSQDFVTDFDTGKGVFIPSQFLSGGYNVVVLNYGSYRFWVSPSESSTPYLNELTSGYWWISHTISGSTSSADDGVGYAYSAGSSSTSSISVVFSGTHGGRLCDKSISDPVLWSNVNIFDDSGNLIHPADSFNLESTIYFNTGFDDLVVESQSSSNFVLPTLEKEGYRFDGWFLDSDFTLPYTTDYSFTGDTTLYAKWSKYVSVSFVTGIDGFDIAPIFVLPNEPFTVPSFSYEGYELMGAYTDDSFENQFVSGSVVDSDLTLYLRFEPVSYNIGALLQKQNERLEVLINVQISQGIMLGVIIIALYFMRRREGFGF